MIGLVLLAAGNSQRFINSIIETFNSIQDENLINKYNQIISLVKSGIKINKVFLEIKQKMIWEYSAEVFANFKDKITNVVFVLNPLTFEFHKKIIEEKVEKYNFENVEFVEGGEKRQDSVFNAIKTLKNKYIDYIIIHDLARPLITQKDISLLIQKIKDFDGLTLYSYPDDSVVAYYESPSYIPRDKIYLIKTPQIFKKESLINAHEELREENLNSEFTDDISLLDFYLFKVSFILGSKYNIKLTTFEDFLFLENILVNHFLK
ncbi:MAG: IspD/TarI family cytidylyltransferase [bacterium]